MSENFQKQGAELTTQQLQLIAAFAKYLEQHSVSSVTIPIATLTGLSLPVEAFGGTDPPIIDSSEDAIVEASIVPALEPGFHPLGVQVSEEFLLKAQLPAQVAMIVKAERPRPAPNFLGSDSDVERR